MRPPQVEPTAGSRAMLTSVDHGALQEPRTPASRNGPERKTVVPPCAQAWAVARSIWHEEGDPCRDRLLAEFLCLRQGTRRDAA